MFLSSDIRETASFLPDFFGDLTDKRVTFIPTASVAETLGFFVRFEKKTLQKLGLIVDELDLSHASQDEITRKVAQNDLIYVSGGNTFYLLQELKRTGTDQILSEAVKNGKFYIGESAGAVIVSPDIEYIGLMDSVKKATQLTGFSALNLVDFYPLPHYNGYPFKKVTKKIVEEYDSKIRLKPITNKQAILVEGDKATIYPSKLS